MPVSHELRCLFVHVPRTGGTSIEAALGMAGDVDVEDEDRLFGRIRSEKYRQLGFGSDFFQHLTLREIRSLESATRSRDYFSFAVVRNPWERAVSVYARLVAGEAGVLAQQLGVALPLPRHARKYAATNRRRSSWAPYFSLPHHNEQITGQ